jgi:hypothetical protein
MKEAVIRELGKETRYWTEYMFGWRGSGALRVDVCYIRKKRKYLVECETRPSIKRLVEKGKRRKKISHRTVYILVVPIKLYGRLDWRRLKGYFDLIMAFDARVDAFTDTMDLRFLGSVRDAALDVLVPIYLCKSVQSLFRWFRFRKNGLKWAVREVIQCGACKLGIKTPWVFCPRFDCPDSVYGYYY